MKLIILLFSFLSFLTISSYSQTLVATYPFAPTSAYNGFWGIAQVNDTLWIGSSSGGKLYKVTKTGTVVDSLTTPFTFNQGLAWDGSGFWIARNASGTASRIIKINTSGVPVDT